ncbi:uncharacterized protein CC84DRAFT_245659 [Paraphaeosphaeria sporulosa]|uniref:Uncharacterized protein n=1 Tax=Paraphaeosphaeria sporulosa TaxID=1460663 RepID=A0A177C041_9PLEO|nr:uncharacterized protein CC84DRAFT_245659 [Paraphaeosphaeria sporulosa]OAG00776.1 hypothetical protein CC84DRAFT_245659 [Paraphaeosphaeria sporulosa]
MCSAAGCHLHQQPDAPCNASNLEPIQTVGPSSGTNSTAVLISETTSDTRLVLRWRWYQLFRSKSISNFPLAFSDKAGFSRVNGASQWKLQTTQEKSNRRCEGAASWAAIVSSSQRGLDIYVNASTGSCIESFGWFCRSQSLVESTGGPHSELGQSRK